MKFITSESVTSGHPDKICDQIADQILDHVLLQDKNARVAIELMATYNTVIISGEIGSTYFPNEKVVENLVRDVVKDIGYNFGNFHYENIQVINLINKQSEDISIGVIRDKEIGAGDQGIMYGYACDSSNSGYIPAPIFYANRLMEYISQNRKNGKFSLLLPDGKCQLTFEFDSNENPVSLNTAVFSLQHKTDTDLNSIKEYVFDSLEAIIPEFFDKNKVILHINPTGRFIKGGPEADTGLTGRKLGVDTYGGIIGHGGGAFSGKDGTKVDRSGAYAARHLAKNIVARGIAKKCLIQVAYVIGVSEPCSININTFNTSKVCEDHLLKWIKNNYSFTPKNMISKLGLQSAIFAPTSSFGHFGRDCIKNYFTWEKIDIDFNNL